MCQYGGSCTYNYGYGSSDTHFECGSSNGYCGDGICNNGEDSISCPGDCPSAPTISLNPTSFTFSGVSGGAAPSGQTMAIGNTGSGTLTWTSSQIGGGTWCSVTPSTGNVAAGGSQTVTINVASLSTAGSFTDCGIRISDPNATNSPRDASITYNVSGIGCGTAATNYSPSSTAYAGTYCTSGNPNPNPPAFPYAGQTGSWTCGSSTCNAPRACVAVSFSSAGSGFSASQTGPFASSLTVSPNQTFYASCDYSALSNSIWMDSVPAGFDCSNWVGSYGTAQIFRCTAPASGGGTFVCGSHTGQQLSFPALDACTASSNPSGTVTVSCTNGDTKPCGSGACSGAQTCSNNAWGACSSSGSTCTSATQCSNAALCDSAGVCPAATGKPSGTVCDDGSSATCNDVCNGSGACAGGSCGSPTVDLKVNGQDTSAGSPLSVPRKDSTNINLSWTVINASSCAASGSWSGAKDSSSGSEGAGPMNTAGSFSYTLTCSGPGGSASDTVYVSVPNCNSLSFVSGNVSPSSVAPSGSYIMSCDYGVSTNQIASVPGSGSCSWSNFVGTSAKFNCAAGNTAGSFANSCATFGPIGPDYYCVVNNGINNLTVGSCANGATQSCGSGACTGTQTCVNNAWGACDYTSSNNSLCQSSTACAQASFCSGGVCPAPTNNPPVNGGWSAWSVCNGGTQTRTCNNPSPSCGGANCIGSSSQSCTLCGNGVVDAVEVCDTAINYGTVSCGSGACAGTKTRTCNNTCSGFDYGACSSSASLCTSDTQCTNAALCDAAGVCPAATGKPSGTVCDDGNSATCGDVCNGSGACAGGSCGSPSAPVSTSGTINPKPITPNGTSTYTITTTAIDANGGSDIATQYVFINHYGAGFPEARGYVGWSNQGFPYENPPSTIACSGGGLGGRFISYDNGYTNLLSCSTSVSGITRTSSFTVSFNPAFTAPTSNNLLSAWANDSGNLADSWRNFETFDLSLPSACTNGATQSCGSGACLGTQTCSGGAWGACSSSGSTCTSATQCSNAALCDSAGVCPAATGKPSGTVCDDSSSATCNDVCNGSGTCAGTSASCPGGGPENGQCDLPNPYNCVKGTSANGAEDSSSWTWNCLGKNGGTNASCSKLKPPPSVSGVTLHAYNSLNDPLPSGNPSRAQCGQIRLAWAPSVSGIAGYQLFKDGDSSPFAAASAASSSYTYNIGGDSSPHSYYLGVYTASGVSTPPADRAASVENPTAAQACQASLSGDKDIVSIGGTNISPAPNACDYFTTPPQASLSSRLNDKVRFKINLCNSGVSSSTSLSIADTMTNLKKPDSGGYNAVYVDSLGGSHALTFKASCGALASGQYCEQSSSDTNQTITTVLKFNLSGSLFDIPKQNGGLPSIGSLIFDGQLTVSAGYTGVNPRFGNSYKADFMKAAGLPGSIQYNTPYLFFYTQKKDPSIIEIP